MRSNARRSFTDLAAMTAALGIAASGCSLIGLGVGAISDSRQKMLTLPGWQIETVAKGRDVVLSLADGSTLAGKFEGLVPEPWEEYRTRYASFRSREGAPRLPVLGPGATVKGRNGVVTQGDLLGFDAGVVLIGYAGRSAPARISLDVVESLSDDQGTTLESGQLAWLASTRALPLQTTIAISGESGRRHVPSDDVRQVVVPATRHGKLAGFLIGAVIDAVVIAAIASDDPPPPPPDTYYSCPFVYSHDGRGFVLDAEVFGGAIFEKAQRADWAALSRLRESDGAYRVKLTNELPETQYVDALSLVVVDHAPGSRIVPTLSGELFELRAPQPAARAADLAGWNVLDLLARPDGRSWISNPFGRDPDDRSQLRDGVVLEFDRPERASGATLALSVRNTAWASYLQGQLLELPGRDIDAWYASLDASPAARERLLDAMQREGMLLVSVWDGSVWVRAGVVWAVGPSVSRGQALRLDLRGIPGDRLLVKLDSTAGLWQVDDVVVDFAAVPLRGSELAISAARDQDGRDVRDLLAFGDGRRYVMPTRRDWAELRFTAPPPVQDRQRSVLVKSSGYYQIRVLARGEPQTALLDRLIDEPGAYAQYTLRLLNERSRHALRTAGAR